MKLPSVSILGAALLAGCALVPQPIARHEGATVTLRPALQGGAFRTQAVVAPYGQADINHLVVKVFKLVNGSEVAVQDGQGTPLLKDIANASLGNPVAFGNLQHDTTYRFRAYAYGDAATTTLISTTDAGSYAEVAVARDDRPTLTTLPVKLIDKTFTGQATTSIVVKEGGLASSGNESFGYFTPPPSGATSILAGTAGVSGAVDGVGTAARFVDPLSCVVDSSGNVYVADLGNNTIRKITPDGTVSTFAGGALSGPTDGIGTAARLLGPAGMTVDGSGNLFVAEIGGHAIRKIVLATAEVTTFAGGTKGSADGTGTAAQFNSITWIASDHSGNLFVSDFGNYTIRKITPEGVVTTLAGTAGARGYEDGTGSAARFASPTGIAVDGSGNVYVADKYRTIRKITPEGVVTTLAGDAAESEGAVDGTGAAARFSNICSLATDGSGNLYASELSNYTIRKIALSTGEVTTFAGQAGLPGYEEGTGTAARFLYPAGLAVGTSGHLFVVDEGNYIIRKITL